MKVCNYTPKTTCVKGTSFKKCYKMPTFFWEISDTNKNILRDMNTGIKKHLKKYYLGISKDI